jgi:hypothetical protein
MDHGVHPGHRAVEGGGIGDGALEELDVEPSQVLPGAGRQVVQDDHPADLRVRDRPASQVRPDEPRSAGDEYVGHDPVPRSQLCTL